MRFVSNAFRQKDAVGESRYSSATNAARNLYRFNQEKGGWQHAPRGAIIFFDGKGSNPNGHVGIYLGDGKNIINAYGKVQEITIENAMAKGDVGKYIGWSYPPEEWRPETASKSQSIQQTGKTEATNAQDGEPKPTSANIEAPGQSETDFTITPTNVQNNEVFHVAVIGDSIAWGAGLTKYEKYSYLVGKWIAEQSNRPVSVKVLAHTGATLEKTSDPLIQYPDLSSGNPTLTEQADMISNPKDVDLILISGAINDVKVGKIIALDYGPLNILAGSTIDEIRERSQKIEEPMYKLLIRLLNKFPKAKIVITGYYPIISKDSKGLTDSIAALEPGSQFLSRYQKMEESTQLNELIAKSDAFYQGSTLSLFGAKQRANKDSGQSRIVFVRIVFPSDKCYGTDGSWLWKIVKDEKGNYKTDDHKYIYRVSPSADIFRLCGLQASLYSAVDCNSKLRHNQLAGVGHPNVDGAKKYSESIIREIIDTWPDWLHPMVLAFEVSPLSLTSGESFKINYKVSSNCSKGLRRVELWRKNETSDWMEIKRSVFSSECGPISGSFTDLPSAPGTYLYGVHVVDNAGKWNDEKNSNTNNPSVSYKPVKVEVRKAYSARGSEICKTADAKSWFEKGNISYGQHNYKEAIKFYDEAIQICRQYEEAWYRKGNAFFLQNNLGEAIRCYDEAIKINPQYADAWNNKGTALLGQDKYGDAIRCYDEAIKINPQHADAWYGKGSTLYHQDNYDDAIRCIDEAITLQPECPVYWEKKGHILKALGSDKAQAAFDKADELKYIHKPTHEAKYGVEYDL